MAPKKTKSSSIDPKAISNQRPSLQRASAKQLRSPSEPTQPIYVQKGQDKGVKVVQESKKTMKPKAAKNTKKKMKSSQSDSDYSGPTSESSTDSEVSSVDEDPIDSDYDNEDDDGDVIPAASKKNAKPASRVTSRNQTTDSTEAAEPAPRPAAVRRCTSKTPASLPTYKELISWIEKNTPSRKRASKDAAGKYFKNLVNVGGKQLDRVTMNRPGEYHGIGLELLGDVPAQITDVKMINALRMISDDNEDMPSAIRQLGIERYVTRFGVLIVFHVIRLWMESINGPVCDQLNAQLNNCSEEDEIDEEDPLYTELQVELRRDKHSRIPCRIKITQIGQSKKGNTVVPEDWMGREFDSSEELHREMDTLDWRRGKPPITYCATLGAMTHVEKQTWRKIKDVSASEKIEVVCQILFDKKSQRVYSKCQEISKEQVALQHALNEIASQQEDDCYALVCEHNGAKILIVCCGKSLLFENESTFSRGERTGLLVSTLQKAIRQGRGAVRVLQDVCMQLAVAPPYTLPDQQFITVSSTRQLLWRLFITCLEDSRLYLMNKKQEESGLLSLQTIVVLSLVCRVDHKLQITKSLLERVIKTALHIQLEDEVGSEFDWRRGEEARANDLRCNLITSDDDIDQVSNAMKIGLRFSPMMSGDARMIRKGIAWMNVAVAKVKQNAMNARQAMIEELAKINLRAFDEVKTIEDMLTATCEDVQRVVSRAVQLAAIDMHCLPAIILEMQSALPFYPDAAFSTKRVSGFIWDYSSKFNVRYSSDATVERQVMRDAKVSLAVEALREIQAFHLDKSAVSIVKAMRYVKQNAEVAFVPGKQADKLTSRIAFLSLFGVRQRVKVSSDKQVELIICGNEKQACKVKRLSAQNQMKYLEDEDRFAAESTFFASFASKPIEITVPPAPVGFRWKFAGKKVKVSGRIVKSDKQTHTSDYEFTVNKVLKLAKPFAADDLLESLPFPVDQQPDALWKALIRQALFIEVAESMESFELVQYLRAIAKERLSSNDFRVFNLRPFIEESVQLKASVIWKHLLVKLFSADEEIVIGPVDRAGKKLQHSISYVYEGAISRFFSLLAAVYPRVILTVGDSQLRFKVSRSTVEYLHMLELIKHFASSVRESEGDAADVDVINEIEDEESQNDESGEDDVADKIVVSRIIDEDGNRKSTRIAKTSQKLKQVMEMEEDDEEEEEEEEEVIEKKKGKKGQMKKKVVNKNKKNKKKVVDSDSEDDSSSMEVEDEPNEQQDDHAMEVEELEQQRDKRAPVRIVTKMWEHQQSTVERISDGFLNWDKRGFGDASCVGAGKTLTALGVMERIYNSWADSQDSTAAAAAATNRFAGFLVLIPSKQLFDTWVTEIRKHSRGFHVVVQNANGTLNPPVHTIRPQDILITTLARIRDHPLYFSWQLVVIDECLSVERREALQTEEAWRQVMISRYGVLMMSATFFRSRFDQLFFMLKMLRSGLPETKDYLDCILNESMVCFIGDSGRKWTTTIHRFELEPKLRAGYESIRRAGGHTSTEKLYGLLADFLYKNYNLVKDLEKYIRVLEKKGAKILIFSRSKAEADEISAEIKGVSRYPDLSEKHVVIAYSEGTYGLNTLTKYNTLLTRPPEPDKLPQMKGRLDRPGQTAVDLELHYFLLADTIEEAWLLRLEIAKKFLSDYIMPLAQFYDAAVGFSAGSHNRRAIGN